METRFNSSELIRQKDDSHLQTIVGRPGAAGFGHVSVHQIGRDQEGFNQFYQKLSCPIQQQEKGRTLMMTQVDRNEVKRLISQGAQLVEVLPKAEYEEEHLPGAINIFLKHLDRKSAAQLDRERPIIVYCHDYQ
jgi:hypothetical protein